ncbi:MAG: hypothetical protein K2X74_01720 [Acetobacteraceae bacterium]|nr:hypothetical protein [Acetobacteraceae bacterium]
MTGTGTGRQAAILDAALEEAAAVGWHDLRLRHVAERLGLGLADLRACYRDADAIADALFARALAAMLATPVDAGAAPSARAATVLLGWFDGLGSHQALAGQMIREKLWPSHPHHWVPMVFNLSRLVHWWREAAHLDAGGLRRQAEEVGLTLALLSVLPLGLSDRSTRRMRTRQGLARRLRFLDGLAAR